MPKIYSSLQHPVHFIAVLLGEPPGEINAGIAGALGVIQQEKFLHGHGPELTGLYAQVPHRYAVVLRPINVYFFFVVAFFAAGFFFAPAAGEPDFFDGTNAVRMTCAICVNASGSSVFISSAYTSSGET